MTEELLWGIIYSALGLACFFMARRAKKLRNEWRQIKEEMNSPSPEEHQNINNENIESEEISQDDSLN